jgi:hypothetical protein
MIPAVTPAPSGLLGSATRFVAPALRWLSSQQLPTGELATYRALSGSRHCWPTPLYSLLSMDLLACADPQTSKFSRRLYEAIPVVDRKYLTSAMVTLRWRLRGYIASQQERNGAWRVHGRDGKSPVDAATTAFACASFFDDRGTDILATRNLAANLARDGADSLFAQAALCYLSACTGKDILDQVPSLLAQSSEQGVARLASCWIFARCSVEIHSPSAASLRETLLAEIVGALAGPLLNNPLSQTLALHTLLILQSRNDQVLELLSQLLLDPRPPWDWQPVPLLGETFCPAFPLALLIHAVAQALEGGILPC